jgi:hypothetical protein
VRTFDDIGVQVPEVLLPKAGIDLARWAVVACDQFTSEPEYWHDVERLVGEAPSTLRLVLPEIYLDKPDTPDRIERIHRAMQSYVGDGTLRPHTGFVYVERSVAGRTRRGIVLAIDLDQYDHSKGASSLIRATEGTIIERLPPRVAVRKGAALELPHVLLLIDDPDETVIGPVASAAGGLETLYDFDLMLGSGHLTGRAIPQDLEKQLVAALRALAAPGVVAEKYGTEAARQPLLFAVGDGNHSLAAAKATWEQMRSSVAATHPARYALVEVVNVHDGGLHFEPIHRLFFGLQRDLLESLRGALGARLRYQAVADAAAMARIVDDPGKQGFAVGIVGSGQAYGALEIDDRSHTLAVGILQPLLDRFLADGGAESVDYVHGTDALFRFGSQAGNAGLYLPAMPKSDLFRTVVRDGALPRKTFSMGEAKEKRFYMEARKITAP